MVPLRLAGQTPGGETIEFLEGIRRGDEEALAVLIGEVWGPLVRYLSGVLGSVDSGQDAAQEAIIRLWEHRERWEAGSARALLFRIGRNVALDFKRRSEARRRSTQRHAAEDPPRPPTPIDQLELTEFQTRFFEAVQSLPPRRREVFELIRYRGLTHKGASEVLGVSPQTVANHMSLALRDLRSLLAAFLRKPGSGATAREVQEME